MLAMRATGVMRILHNFFVRLSLYGLGLFWG